MYRTVFVIATLLLGYLAAGCSPRAEPKTDIRFDVNKGLFTTIHDAERITLYEGLPHQFEEKYLLDQEKRSKETVDFQGFAFYATPIELKEGTRAELVGLLGDERSFTTFRGPKGCGRYHPDYCVEWAVRDRTYRALICFGCEEIKVYGPDSELHCDIVERDLLKRILKPYRKNRPVRELWPNVAEPSGPPDPSQTTEPKP